MNAPPAALTYARLAWRHGLTVSTLTAMDVPARAALADEAGVDLAGFAFTDALTRLAAMYAALLTAHADKAPPQDLTDAPKPWQAPGSSGPARPAEPAGPVPSAGGPAPEPPTDPDPTPAPAPKLPAPPGGHTPTGWAALSALGPLPAGIECHYCDRAAVTVTDNTCRCPDHPPQPGEWGWRLDYTPDPATTCAPARCYCRRCPSYTPPRPPTRKD